MKKVLRYERILKDITNRFGEIYSIPNLLNAVLCFAEILDMTYYIVDSEFSFKKFFTLLFWLVFFALKLILMLKSSTFAELKVSFSFNDISEVALLAGVCSNGMSE